MAQLPMNEGIDPMTDRYLTVNDRAAQWAGIVHRLYLEDEAAPYDANDVIELEPVTLKIPPISPARSMGMALATILTLHGMTAVVEQVTGIDVKAARWIEQHWHGIELKGGAVWMS